MKNVCDDSTLGNHHKLMISTSRLEMETLKNRWRVKPYMEISIDMLKTTKQKLFNLYLDLSTPSVSSYE